MKFSQGCPLARWRPVWVPTLAAPGPGPRGQWHCGHCGLLFGDGFHWHHWPSKIHTFQIPRVARSFHRIWLAKCEQPAHQWPRVPNDPKELGWVMQDDEGLAQWQLLWMAEHRGDGTPTEQIFSLSSGLVLDEFEMTVNWQGQGRTVTSGRNGSRCGWFSIVWSDLWRIR